MTEKELLEKAAKATNRKRHPIISGAWSGDGLEEMRDSSMSIRVPTVWNPLNDDGDALRLAVKLGLLTYENDIFNRFFAECIEKDMRPSEATRLAITRAAAAMADKE